MPRKKSDGAKPPAPLPVCPALASLREQFVGKEVSITHSEGSGVRDTRGVCLEISGDPNDDEKFSFKLVGGDMFGIQLTSQSAGEVIGTFGNSNRHHRQVRLA